MRKPKPPIVVRLVTEVPYMPQANASDKAVRVELTPMAARRIVELRELEAMREGMRRGWENCIEWLTKEGYIRIVN